MQYISSVSQKRDTYPYRQIDGAEWRMYASINYDIMGSDNGLSVKKTHCTV